MKTIFKEKIFDMCQKEVKVNDKTFDADIIKSNDWVSIFTVIVKLKK